jgi:hypothetical protein
MLFNVKAFYNVILIKIGLLWVWSTELMIKWFKGVTIFGGDF